MHAVLTVSTMPDILLAGTSGRPTPAALLPGASAVSGRHERSDNTGGALARGGGPLRQRRPGRAMYSAAPMLSARQEAPMPAT